MFFSQCVSVGAVFFQNTIRIPFAIRKSLKQHGGGRGFATSKGAKKPKAPVRPKESGAEGGELRSGVGVDFLDTRRLFVARFFLGGWKI